MFLLSTFCQPESLLFRSICLKIRLYWLSINTHHPSIIVPVQYTYRLHLSNIYLWNINWWHPIFWCKAIFLPKIIKVGGNLTQLWQVLRQTNDSLQHSIKSMCRRWWHKRWQQSEWETRAAWSRRRSRSCTPRMTWRWSTYNTPSTLQLMNSTFKSTQPAHPSTGSVSTTSTNKSWDVNRHSAWYTSPASVVLQC